MPEPRVVVLSLVERGWQAARGCSLALSRSGVCVIHVIKGRLSRAVRELIAPAPNGRIISMHPQLFWPAAWGLLAWWRASGRLRSILVDNERSYNRLRGLARFLHLDLTVVRTGTQGYELWGGSGRVAEATWRKVLGG